jgi:hypothetical protein
MKKLLVLGALALAAQGAFAAVVCDSCDYQPAPSVASNLGLHNTLTDDNSTFSNATTGQNGDFSNWWVFSIDPAGLASINAIFLPIQNISNFAVDLFSVDNDICAANTAVQSGACSLLDVIGGAITSLTNPSYSTVIDFTGLDAGTYAFNVRGTITGLGPTQPASYTGNLQVNQLAEVPEPGSLALAGLGLLGLGFLRRKAA